MVKSHFNLLKKEIERLKNGDKSRVQLPENCYYLNDDHILCGKREWGDSRYPYYSDGLVLNAFSSGYIFLCESTYQIFPPVYEGKEPYINFYLGVKNGDNFFPYSINGTGQFAFEKNVKRYVVYSSSAVCYFLETDGLSAMLRAFVGNDKRVYFSIYVENNGDTEKDCYISAFFNPLMRFSNNETFEDKWFKGCKVQADGFMFDNLITLKHKVIHKYANIQTLYDGNFLSVKKTTSRADYVGNKNGSISSSSNLIKGDITERSATKFIDTAIAGDMTKFTLKNGESVSAHYVLSLYDEPSLSPFISLKSIDDEMEAVDKVKADFGKDFQLKFSGMDKFSDECFNNFILSVQKQVNFCGSGKSYANHLLGVRDLFQSLEAMLLWNKKVAREKIKEALSFCGIDGRMPRQYSIPPQKDVLPELDLREFIDQGNWVIDAVYEYMAYTGDMSILKEICGYYSYSNDDKADFSYVKEDIFCHLKRIMDYLIGCIDEKTGCLRAMYGDWNDALDGLGKTDDNNKKFGSGVSVMATLHLIKNLKEFSEICHKVNKENLSRYYMEIREKVIHGVLKYAVAVHGNEKKILHGWGDKRAYSVGGFCDCDGENRDSLAVNAFFVISGMSEYMPDMKKHILSALHRLDSKYGFRTFNPPFKEGDYGVGRISYLPVGTAENGASYNHATLFGVWALYMMGEDKWAWETIEKVVPLTHEHISVTPFIMNNSYVCNEEYNMDGQSMNDWHTGSSNVLIKILARCICGINCDLTSVTISPKSLPSKSLQLKTIIKGREFLFNYNHTSVIKGFIINGEVVDNVKSIVISNKDIAENKKFIIETY